MLRALAVLATLLALVWKPSHVAADANTGNDAVACVQKQLNALEYDVGLADGLVRQGTRAATSQAIKDIGPQLAEGLALRLPFNTGNAAAWCRTLGLHDPALKAAWPGRTPLKIYTDQASEGFKARFLTELDRDVRGLFAERYDIEIANSFALVGTDRPDSISGHIQDLRKDRGRARRKRAFDSAGLCEGRHVGAAANRDFIALCWQKPAIYDEAWIKQQRAKILPIYAHEFMHQAQYELAFDRPARYAAALDDFLLGPSWMVEGSAEMIEELVRTPSFDFTKDTTLFNMQSPARRNPVRLSALTQSQSVKGSAAYGTARFAAYLLARRHGVQALFEYFEALGELQDRDAAFLQVFEQSFAEFEIEFERLRRDFGAARRG